MAVKEQDLKTNGSNGYKVIGSRPVRHDGTDKVTGRAVYGADVRFPGMLHGAVLRSPHAHARILSIDISEAEALPGVHAVVTGQDLPDPGNRIESLGEGGATNLRYFSNNVLAKDKVNYHMHAVAAVAAINRHVAEEATKLIKVEYEVLEPVTDVRHAMSDDAPILIEEMRTDEFGQKGDKPSNIASHFRHELGDIEAGFAEADVVLEREFFASPVHQGYIEPHSATAIWRADGKVEVWTSTQGAFGVRAQTADLLAVPVVDVKVTPTEIGGGFGGKTVVYLPPVAALLSKKSGARPVKIAMTRAAVIGATGPNSGSYVTVKIGAKKDGRITAAQASLAYEAGGFPGSPVGAATSTIFAPYDFTNVQIDGYDVLLNKPKAAAYRAPGATNAAAASETVLDELAETLEMDPIDLRMINGAKEGTRIATGKVFERIGYIETLEAAKAHPHYSAPLESKTGNPVGRGVASGYWGNWGGQSSATANLNSDGTINLVEGSSDIGGTRTSLAMQLAEALGLDTFDINPQVADTDSVGYNDVTGGSRTTYSGGVVVVELAKKLVAEMSTHAADLWDAEADAVKFDGGVFSHNGDSMGFKDLAKEISGTGASLSVSGSVHPQRFGPGFATHVVDVEVDPDTGKVTILRYTAIQDVGKAIHPSYAEGQIQGGAVQGIGWALNEEYYYDDEGHLRNASLLDYRMPTALDLPMIETVMVEVGCPNHPYGVRGVGEVPIVPPPAAIANAIYQAVGVRMNVLPMSPPRLAEAIWKKNGS
ncbi:MAG: xanthine dehydrogenase family protein molybdopterin-binding subunit [Chloroflexota bacterium]